MEEIDHSEWEIDPAGERPFVSVREGPAIDRFTGQLPITLCRRYEGPLAKTLVTPFEMQVPKGWVSRNGK